MISVLSKEHCTKDGSIRLFVRANLDGGEQEWSLHLCNMIERAIHRLESLEEGEKIIKHYQCLYRGGREGFVKGMFLEFVRFLDRADDICE